MFRRSFQLLLILSMAIGSFAYSMEEAIQRPGSDVQYLLVNKNSDQNIVSRGILLSQKDASYSETLRILIENRAGDRDSDSKIAIIKHPHSQEVLTIVAQSLKFINRKMQNDELDCDTCAQRLSYFLTSKIVYVDSLYELIGAINFFDSSILHQALTIACKETFGKWVYKIKDTLKMQQYSNDAKKSCDRHYAALGNLVVESGYSFKVTELFWDTIGLMQRILSGGCCRDDLSTKFSEYIADKLGDNFCHIGQFIAITHSMQAPLLMSLIAEFCIQNNFDFHDNDLHDFPYSFVQAYYFAKFLDSQNDEQLRYDIAKYVHLLKPQDSGDITCEVDVLSVLGVFPSDLQELYYREGFYPRFGHPNPSQRGKICIDWENLILNHFEKYYSHKEKYLVDKGTVDSRIFSSFNDEWCNFEILQGSKQSSSKQKFYKKFHPKVINLEHVSLFNRLPRLVQDEVLSNFGVLTDNDILDGSLDALYKNKDITVQNYYTVCIKQFLLNKSADALKELFESIKQESYCKMIIRAVYCEKAKNNIDDYNIKKVLERVSFYSSRINLSRFFDGNEDPLFKHFYTLIIVLSGYCRLNYKLLDLHGNHLTDLPEGLFDLTHLESLKLGSNALESVPKAIRRLNELTHLDISENEDLQVLPPEIGDLTKLKSLNIATNPNLEFPDNICRLTQLEELDISWCDCFEDFPQGFSQLTRLKQLDISHTDLYNHLKGVICNLTSLEVLKMNECYVQKIPKDISNLKKLTKFEMNCNALKSIPDAMLQLPHLREVDIRGNEVCDFHDMEISSELRAQLGEGLLHD